jgi:molecular chaperone GrpE
LAEKSSKKKSIPIESAEETAEDKNMQEEEQKADVSEVSKETDQTEAETMETIKEKMKVIQQEKDQEADRLLRLMAEFENYKKRMDRQMNDFRKYANESLLKDLLIVVDNLERALNTSGDANNGAAESSVIEGVEMTLNETMKILKKYNVTPIEALGKPFDPVFHEAVMQEESEEQPENTVLNEFQKGYMIHDRLLRPSMVVVSKGK